MTKAKNPLTTYAKIVSVAADTVSAYPNHDPETLEHAKRHAEGGNIHALKRTAEQINDTRHTLPGFHPPTLIVFSDLVRQGLMIADAPAGQFADFVNRACKGVKMMASRPGKALRLEKEDIAAAYAALNSPLFD